MKKVLISCLAVLLGASVFAIDSPKLQIVNAADEQELLKADYTVANDNWQLLSHDNKGFKQENGQLTLVNDGTYDASANGAWLTYKIDVTPGYTLSSLKVAMVGNRLGSFGKAAGASENTVSFKPFISTTEEFAEPIEEVILPTSTECYNLNYDFSSHLAEGASSYYVKLWFGSSAAGVGFYYDWFQLGTVKFSGVESGTKETEPSVIDASAASVVLEKTEYTETGSDIKPVPVVSFAITIDGLTDPLTKDADTNYTNYATDNADYYVTYENCLEPGTAKVTIHYLGNYKGESVANYTITAVPIEYNDADLSVHEYVPDKFDFVDYWGGIGNIDNDSRQGVTTFAHIASTVPLKGTAISLDSSFMLLSKQADDVDGWVTYSFSATPGIDASDKSFPYYGGQVSGYFLHITNYSTEANPNTVEIQFVKSVNGDTSSLVDKFFVDNLVTNSGKLANDEVKFDFDLRKLEDGSWKLSFVNKATKDVIVEKTYAYLNERLFINEKGQTFFSTAIYEGTGCDGDHWLHRGVKVYNMDVFTLNATNAEVNLSQTEFEYEEGGQYKPTVQVVIGNKTLQKDLDYYCEYANNKAIGEAKVRVNFVGEYAGNDPIDVNFTIKAKEQEQTSIVSSEEPKSEQPSVEPSVEPKSEQPSTPAENSSKPEEGKKKGCKGGIGASGLISLLALAGSLLFKKTRK